MEAVTVVVVDDLPEIRELVTLMLESFGTFRVVGGAASTADAVAAARDHRPDVLLLDLYLSGGHTGWEAIEQIKSLSPGTKVVILSGSGVAPPVGLERVAQLVDARIEKGVSGGELASTLLDVVGRSPLASGTEALVGQHAGVLPVADDSEEAGWWLASIIESSNDAIVGKKLDGTIVSWNSGAEQMYGYRPDEVIGKNVALLVPPDRPDEIPRILARIRDGYRVAHYETIRVTKDGRRLNVSLGVSPVLDPDGNVVGASAIARNITERRATEVAMARAVAELERQNRELSRANEELDHFAYVASHDLAQPLQVSYGYIDLLREEYGGNLDEQGRKWLDSAATNLDRMRNLVREILHFARAGSTVPSVEEIDATGPARSAVNALAATIEERGADVRVGTLPRVAADATLLTQVFQNLIANAIKFVPEARPPVVDVVGTAKAGVAEIRVIDNGIGIPVERREQIFEMFQRGGAGAGTGLGLSIVKRVVESHSGRVWVDDAPEGSGTAFCFTLPPA